MFAPSLKLLIKLTIWLISEIFCNAIAIDDLVDYSEFLFEKNLANQEKLIALIEDSIMVNQSNFRTGKAKSLNQPSPVLFPLPSPNSLQFSPQKKQIDRAEKSNPNPIPSLARCILSGFPWIVLVSVYGFSIALLHHWGLLIPLAIERASAIVAIALTIVLGLSLSWRIYQARTRFKSAIELWQSMGKAIDFLARGMCFYIEEPTPQARYDKESVMQLGLALVVAMKLHWRGQPIDELKPLVTQLEYKRLQVSRHAPLDITLWIDDYLQRQHQKHQLNEFQLTVLSDRLEEIVNLLGNWETLLKKSPPLVLTNVSPILATVYFLILPLAMVSSFGLITGLVMGAVTSIYLILDRYNTQKEDLLEKKHWNYIDFLCNRLGSSINTLIRSTYRPQPRTIINLPPKAA